MYGMEEEIARQTNRDIYEEVRRERLARAGGGKSGLGRIVASVLHIRSTREKEV